MRQSGVWVSGSVRKSSLNKHEDPNLGISTYRESLHLCAWREDGKTPGAYGQPVSHSMSPRLSKRLSQKIRWRVIEEDPNVDLWVPYTCVHRNTYINFPHTALDGHLISLRVLLAQCNLILPMHQDK